MALAAEVRVRAPELIAAMRQAVAASGNPSKYNLLCLSLLVIIDFLLLLAFLDMVGF
jgi:hypothetical protein